MIQAKSSAKVIVLSAGGIFILFIGVLVYLLDRSPENLFLLSKYHIIYPGGKNFLHDLAYNLPVLFHITGFSMITKCFFLDSKRADYLIPLAWGSINIVLEFGQLYYSESIPVFTGGRHYIQVVREVFFQYFQFGVFDWLDILFAILGVIFTCLLFKLIKI